MPQFTALPVISNEDYEAAEPRQLVGVSKEVDVAIPNETRESRFLSPPVAKLGIWRKNVWLTKSPAREKRALLPSESTTNVLGGSSSVPRFPGSFDSGQEAGDHSPRISRSTETITPQDFVSALASRRSRANATDDCAGRRNVSSLANATESFLTNFNDSQPKANFKREDSYQATKASARETRQLYAEENFDNVFPSDSENSGRSWQSKEHIASEMEDVFLRGASQALTKYIERQLHPAIKETLMISMGYTVSYG